MQKLLTSDYKLDLAKRLVNSISDTASTAYYLYVSDHLTSNSAPSLSDTNEQKVNKLYNTMLFGKKISTSDAKLIIKNVPYQQNKIFKMYEHDVELVDEDFYCIVDEGSYFHAYKCLDNNFNSPSTVEPILSYFSSSDNYIARLSDGYVWKYMYSISSTLAQKFSISNFFPIQANSTISDAAINGSIDVIKILDGGKNYNNYTQGTFLTTDLRINGNQKRYRVDKASANGYLNDCLLYISAGTGAGQFANIVTYFSDQSGNFVDIDKEFVVAPQNQSQYEITPKVIINSNGRETKTAVARALVNAYSSNSIYRIEMMKKGENYEYATATVSANVTVSVEKAASLKLIYSPFGGHGKNVEKELLSTRCCFSVKLSNTELNTIPATNDYHQIGIIKDPLFSETQFTIANFSSSYLYDEKIYKINPILIATNATITELSSTISATEADFQNQLSVGQFLYLKGPNSSDHQLVVVNSTTNSTTFTVKSNCNFSSTNAYIYYANTSSFASVLRQSNAETLFVNAVFGVFSTSDIILGENSGCRSTISAIKRNTIEKPFNTFIQMYKYEGKITSGTFEEDDLLFQGNNLANATAKASLHSITAVDDNVTIYTSNQIGEFDLARPLYGQSNSGVCALTSVYYPELIYGSGEVIYINNIDAITRQSDQSEQFKIVFEF